MICATTDHLGLILIFRNFLENYLLTIKHARHALLYVTDIVSITDNTFLFFSLSGKKSKTILSGSKINSCGAKKGSSVALIKLRWTYFMTCLVANLFNVLWNAIDEISSKITYIVRKSTYVQFFFLQNVIKNNCSFNS